MTEYISNERIEEIADEYFEKVRRRSATEQEW